MIDATQPKREKKLYKVVLILLIGLASISTARQDLNQLISTATEVGAFANHLAGVVGSGKPRTSTACEMKRFVPVAGRTELFRLDQGRVIQLTGGALHSSSVGIQ